MAPSEEKKAAELTVETTTKKNDGAEEEG